MKRLAVLFILILAFFGLADSLYIVQQAQSGTPLICDIGVLGGCNTVAASEYSRAFGIPLAEYGVFFYGLLFILAAIELVLYNRLLRRVLQGLAAFVFLFSVYSTILQIFVINAFCIYCIASAVISLLTLVCASYIEPIRVRKEDVPPASPLTPPHLKMPPAV